MVYILWLVSDDDLNLEDRVIGVYSTAKKTIYKLATLPEAGYLKRYHIQEIVLDA